MAKRRPRKQETKELPLLTRRQREMLLMVLLRKESVFNKLLQHIKPEHFGDSCLDLGIIWAIAADHYEEYGHLPSEEYVAAEFERRIEDAGDEFDDALIEQADAFLQIAYSLADNNLDEAVADNFAQRLIEEHLLVDLKDTLSITRGIPERFAELLADYTQRSETVKAINTGNIQRITEGGWNVVPVIRTPTNVAFFDDFLRGGDAPLEIYGVMAPYGVCKTLLLLQLALERAKYCYHNWTQSNKKKSLGLVYYFQYEEPMRPEILIRAASYLGQVNKNRLEDNNDWMRDLSTSTNLQPYEKDMYSKQLSKGEKVLGEVERLKHSRIILETSWIGVGMNEPDVSGNSSRGGGYVAEIAAIIEKDLEFRKRELGTDVHVAGVYIDYLGALVDKYVDAQGLDPDESRVYLKKFANRLRKQVLAKYNCPAWLAHQFGAEGNQKAPGVPLHHTQAAECRTVGENWNFAFMIGNKDQNECCVISQTKGRRMPGAKDKILLIEGAFSRVRDTAGAYVLDNNRIVPASDFYAAGHDIQTPTTKTKEMVHEDDEEDIFDDLGD